VTCQQLFNWLKCCRHVRQQQGSWFSLLHIRLIAPYFTLLQLSARFQQIMGLQTFGVLGAWILAK
jgi:hypothetical protein